MLPQSAPAIQFIDCLRNRALARIVLYPAYYDRNHVMDRRLAADYLWSRVGNRHGIALAQDV